MGHTLTAKQLIKTLSIQVYWAGPILGGVAAALLYVLAFAAPELDVHVSEKYRQVQTADEKEVTKIATLA